MEKKNHIKTIIRESIYKKKSHNHFLLVLRKSPDSAGVLNLPIERFSPKMYTVNKKLEFLAKSIFLDLEIIPIKKNELIFDYLSECKKQEISIILYSNKNQFFTNSQINLVQLESITQKLYNQFYFFKKFYFLLKKKADSGQLI
jgi:thymidine kinase